MASKSNTKHSSQPGIIEHDDSMVFHMIFPCLLWYVNERHDRMCPAITSVPDVITAALNDDFHSLRLQLYKDMPGIIDDYIRDNMLGHPDFILDLIKNWKYCKIGYFAVYKYMPNGNAVLIGPLPDPEERQGLIAEEDVKVYEVSGLPEPVSKLLTGRTLPILAKAVVLPFKGRIVIDGVLAAIPDTVPNMDKIVHTYFMEQLNKNANAIVTQIELKPENMYKHASQKFVSKPSPKEMENKLTVYYLMWSQPINKEDPFYHQGYKRGLSVVHTLQASDKCLCSSGKTFGACCGLKPSDDRPMLCAIPPATKEEASYYSTQYNKVMFAPMESHVLMFHILDLDKLVNILDSLPYFVNLKNNSYLWRHDIPVVLDGINGVVSYGSLDIKVKEKKLKIGLLSRPRVMKMLQILIGAGCENVLANAKLKFKESEFEGGSKPVLSDTPYNFEPFLKRFPQNMCHHCSKTASASQKLLSCSNCRLVHYCSRDCQKADWRNHKQMCKKQKS